MVSDELGRIRLFLVLVAYAHCVPRRYPRQQGDTQQKQSHQVTTYPPRVSLFAEVPTLNDVGFCSSSTRSLSTRARVGARQVERLSWVAGWTIVRTKPVISDHLETR